MCINKWDFLKRSMKVLRNWYMCNNKYDNDDDERWRVHYCGTWGGWYTTWREAYIVRYITGLATGDGQRLLATGDGQRLLATYSDYRLHTASSEAASAPDYARLSTGRSYAATWFLNKNRELEHCKIKRLEQNPPITAKSSGHHWDLKGTNWQLTQGKAEAK